MEQLLSHMFPRPDDQFLIKQYLFSLSQGIRPNYMLLVHSNTGGVGKSALFNIICEANRGSTFTNLSEVRGDHQNGYGRASLENKSIIVVEECDGESSISWLKSLITCKKCKMGEKFKSRETTKLTFQIICLTNHDIFDIRDQPESRRVLVVDIVQSVPFTEAFPGVTKQLEQMENDQPLTIYGAVNKWLASFNTPPCPDIAPDTVYKTILYETSCRGDKQDLVAEYVAEAKDGGFNPSGKGYRSFLQENGHTWAKNKSTKELQCNVDRYMRLADMREDESQPTDADFSD